MNGFISPKALRFTLVASACLLSGFVSGAHFQGLNLDALFPKQEINYSKISWISGAFDTNKVALATVDYPASDLANQEIKLAEFHLPTRNFYAKRAPKIPSHNLEKLGELVAQAKTFDLFKDYRQASEHLRENFVLAMNHPAMKSESVVMASSSALKKNEDTPLEASEAVSAVIEQKIEKNEPASMKAPKPARKQKLVRLNTQKLDNQKSFHAPKKVEDDFAVGRIGIPDVAEIQETPVKMAPEKPLKVETVQSSADSYSIEEDSKKTEEEVLHQQLQNQLIEQHIQNYVKVQNAPKQTLATATKPPATAAPSLNASENEIDHSNDVHNVAPTEKPSIIADQTACKILPKLHLMKPAHGDEAENTQICPTQQSWISKSWGEEGWAKVEAEGYFPFLTYYPQVTSNKTLLLDQNAVALVAIKSGIHFEHGMGIVLGTLPQGYKVEFSGRAEDVEYFELNSRKYFVILNVEPGAGVTELVSEKDQTENATVFTPVLGDTVTYLDFAAPVSVNIPVKIVKSGDDKETVTADVAGLTVGISTQTQVQAITQANGTTVLRNVRMVPGYPVFVDVSSKLNGERSYQYRYQLNKRTKMGVFVLKQYPEKLIYQWLKQVKTGLSDQSGMVFGQFNRKRLDGFKKNYSVKVESITEKFGLVAKNYTVLWDEKLSDTDPLEGDRPRFLSVQVPEGLTQAHLINESNQIIQTSLIPVSPRVINVVSE